MHVDPSATLQRQWAMLRLIPAWPQTILRLSKAAEALFNSEAGQ
jgi:hypothetical protein